VPIPELSYYLPIILQIYYDFQPNHAESAYILCRNENFVSDHCPVTMNSDIEILNTINQ